MNTGVRGRGTGFRHVLNLFQGWFRFLAIFIILLVSGCRGEKIEAPPLESDTSLPTATEPALPPDTLVVGKAPEEDVEVKYSAPMNTPPEIVSIKLTPRLTYPGMKIKALVEARDEDGEPVTFDYKWKRNNDTLSGAVLDELDTTGFKKGDFITVTVTPFDGKEKGTPRKSLPLIIANMPPEIISTPSVDVSDSRYTYEVKAKDKDGDTLSFSLEESPPGMTINPVTGIIEWSVPPESDGIFQIKIIVTDGDAKAFQVFSLNLKKK